MGLKGDIREWELRTHPHYRLEGVRSAPLATLRQHMATYLHLDGAALGLGCGSGVAPSPNEYLKTHKVRGVPRLGDQELRDCTRLILYNVQGFTVSQVWTELRATLGELSRSIRLIKCVSNVNRNPHMDLWVEKGTGSALINVVRQQNKVRIQEVDRVVTEAQRNTSGILRGLKRPGDETRFAAVTHWRIALWQPWRERRLSPAKSTPEREPRASLVNASSWNINGFWSKRQEVMSFCLAERCAVLALQETLVTRKHYPIQLNGYRVYQSPAEEDFRGAAVLVDNSLGSYEVPHGLRWLVHVKIFGFAGWSGPTHFLNVYLKSGGNHRSSRREMLGMVKAISWKILIKNPEARLVLLGDFNEDTLKAIKHLNVGVRLNPYVPVPVVGSDVSRFPVRGSCKSLDHVFISEGTRSYFRPVRVLRKYNASDHRPLLLRPRAQQPATKSEKERTSFDSKMIYLKSDLVANDNAWSRLMMTAFGNDLEAKEEPEDDEVGRVVSDEATNFIATFDRVCRKHEVKKVHQPGTKRAFPRKLKLLLQTVRRYQKKVDQAKARSEVLKEPDVVRLAHAQRRFKKAKKEWEIRLKQKFYSSVADDFVANDHQAVWKRLHSQTALEATAKVMNPVKDKEGVLHHTADRILATMREHYSDLLTHDPEGISQNAQYWEEIDLGDPGPSLEALNDGLRWPEVLDTIRGMNRNTAPGVDSIHINVLKSMVMEESMERVMQRNPKYKRPDNVRVALPLDQLPITPITPLGKSFFALLNRTWQSGCIPEQWQEVQIVSLYKGGDPEDTNNYRGISLISCAFKVLITVMANRLSRASEKNDLMVKEQAGFRRREEAVAQSIALAEIVRRRFLEGRPTFGVFIDFKKAYDRVYHEYLFRILDHNGVRGRFLTLVKNMYRKTKYSVRIGDHVSEPFTPTRGAKQGDPLSPILFILFINSCLQKGNPVGVRVPGTPHGENCTGLMYADDVAALANSVEGALETIDGIWKWGQKNGMDGSRERGPGCSS